MFFSVSVRLTTKTATVCLHCLETSGVSDISIDGCCFSVMHISILVKGESVLFCVFYVYVFGFCDLYIHCISFMPAHSLRGRIKPQVWQQVTARQIDLIRNWLLMGKPSLARGTYKA